MLANRPGSRVDNMHSGMFMNNGRIFQKLTDGFTGKKFKKKDHVPTPLEDKKGQPAQPKPQQSTPKSNGLKTWHKAAIGAAAVGAVGAGIYAYKQYKNKPKSVIAKRIAALRSIYSKFMRQVQSNPQKANMLKRAAAKILSVIDKLMGYLQNKADGR